MTWEELAEVVEKVAPGSTPIVESIEFQYEDVTTRDGAGRVTTHSLEPIGASVAITLV